MTRMEFLKKHALRIAASVVLAGLLFYVVYHVFFATSKAPNTAPVRSITDYQILGGQGYLFREEAVLSVPQAGLVNVLQTSGEKVSKGAMLCEVWNGYTQESLDAAQRELDRLQALIAVLENSKEASGGSLIKAEQYRTEAMSSYRDICQLIASGQWQGMNETTDAMLTALSRYQALTGDRDAIEAALRAAEQASASLFQGERALVINDRGSGYFYDRSYVDGFETVFVPSALENISAASLAAMIASPAPTRADFAVGKLVLGNRWYLAIPFSQDVSPFFEAGEVYAVDFPDNARRTLQMRCESLTADADGACVVVLSSTEISPDFVFLRSQRIEITVGSCQGYYVPASALYSVDGYEGVYIFQDSTAYFRYIEVLYRGDGYVIAAEQGERDDAYLALHDVMILSDPNLYHGKVFR